MASRFETSGAHFFHFEPTRDKLSDSVIAHVQPHGRPSTSVVNGGVALKTPLAVSARMPVVSESPYVGGWAIRARSPDTTELMSLRGKLATGAARTRRISTLSRRASVRVQSVEEEIRAYEVRKAIRREQCRTNQARYRDRQRTQERRLQRTVHELHEEVQGLKLKRERQRYSQKTNRSPWAIVSEVFQLLEVSFRPPWRAANGEEMKLHVGTKENLKALQKSFTLGVTMGELSGVEALIEQLRRWSLYFGEPQLHLQRVEEVVPGVLTATARLRVTVSEFTLRCVFPHLSKTKDEDAEDEDELQSLREKLLNQRLTCSCTMTFLQDEETGRMERLETSVDWMGALCQLLGDVSAVEHVLDQALLSSEGAVGDLTDHT